MTLQELPQEIQNELNAKRANLYKDWFQNDAWNVVFTNKEGTRYFSAYRRNDFGQFNAGKWATQGWWEVRYGKILWDANVHRNPLGECETEYFWKRTNKIFGKSANGTEIPREVHTKAEVLEIAKKIGILEMSI